MRGIRTMCAVGVVSLAVCRWAGAETVGCVLSSAGEPVAGAEIAVVVAESEGDRLRRLASGIERTVVENAVSDESGLVSLATNVAAEHRVLIRAPGYAPAAVDPTDFSTGWILVPADLVDGRVAHAGAPVRGALVAWLGPNGKEWLQTTDEDGRYRVPDPEVWATRVVAFHPQHGVAFDPFAVRDPLGRSGNRTDLEMPDSEVIDGAVVDLNGDPVAGAVVSVGGWPLTVTGDGGRFRIPAAAGELVTATRQTFVASAGVDGVQITLTLRPGRRLSGKVVDGETGAPTPSVQVIAWDRGGFDAPRDTLTDGSGRFDFGPLPPREFSVGVGGSSWARQSRFEQADLRRRQRIDLELELSRAKRVNGVVIDKDGAPVSAVPVLLLGESEPVMLAHGRALGARMAISGCDGRFSMPVPEGAMDFRLAAVPRDHAPAVSALIDEAATAPAVKLRIGPGRAVEGVVTDPDGRPLADVEVAVLSSSRMARAVPASELFGPFTGLEWIHRTDADGRFRVPLGSGDWVVAFGKEGFVPNKRNAAVGDGPLEEIAVVLNPAVPIRGRVVDSAGEPVAFASMSIGLAGDSLGVAGSDADGFFELMAPQAGRFTLFVFDPNSDRRTSLSVQAPGTDVVVELPATVRISGRVVDGETGEPVPGAWITSTMVGRPSDHFGNARSGLDGSYSIDVHEAGTYQLEVQVDGYRKIDPVEIQVAAGEGSAEVVIELERGLSVSGRVVDPGGEAVVAAQIRATQVDDQGREVIVRDTTDPDGAFELNGLAGGSVELSVSAEGFVPSDRSIELDGDMADLVVEIDPGAVLHGRVVDGNGKPLSSVRIVGRASAPRSQRLYEMTDEDGAFSLAGMGPGPWQITAELDGYDSSTIDDLDPEARESVTIVLGKLVRGTIFGTISGAEDSATVSLFVSSQDDASGWGAHGEMDDDGSYRIDEAPAGSVQVTAMELGYGARRTRVEEVVVPEGGEVRLDFDFDDGAEVGGRVTKHGKPVAGAFVAVRSSVFGGAEAVTDSDGYFRCSIPDGAYELSVMTIDGLEREIEIIVEGPTTVDVDLGGGTVIGRVVDGETGRPISGVEVRADGSGTATGSSELTTDSSGAFRFDDLPPGEHELRFAHPIFVQQRHTVTVVTGSVSELDVVLEKAEGMRVFLVDGRTSAPLSGTVVARNMSNEVVFDGVPRKDGKGVRLPLPAGSYKVSASATGYATHTIIADAPSDEVVIRLTPGGTLIVRAEDPTPRVGRLVMPSGEEYIRCWCNRVAEIRLEGSITGIENIAAGSYDLVVSERDGSESSYPVTVIEDQTVEVLIE